MKTIAGIARVLGLGLILAAAGTAHGGGGQDFPFFCHLNSDGAATMKIASDPRSTTGFTVQLFDDRGALANYMEADVKPSDDGRYWVVYGTERVGALHDRQVMAYVGKDTEQPSLGEVRTALRNSQRHFDLQPISCADRE